jgi:hexokinase
MNVTWVLGLPTGHEKGTFLTLDLGGTNLRVCKVELHGSSNTSLQVSSKHSLTQEQYKLPDEIKTGTAEQLWSYIAEYLERFMHDQGFMEEYSQEKKMPLGFTFSYPATQHRIDNGILQTWTKGFNITGVEGEDVTAQLKNAMEERKLPIELVCLANDTVGAMIASAYTDPETIIGAIFGTGCNAACLQNLSPSSIPKLQLSQGEWEKVKEENLKMAINCEYGAFDNAKRVLPLTKFDEQVDAESPRPGEQAFEKLSAGLYLGEIFRLVMIELLDKGLVFNGQDTDKLRTPYILDTGFLSQIEDDSSPKFSKSRDMFQDTMGIALKDEEIELSRRLAELIATRGARLCACGIAAICSKENISSGHVAADGSVANKHPKFKKRWAKALGEILDWDEGGKETTAYGQTKVRKDSKTAIDDDPIVLTSAEDGSGVGVAVIAAMTIERRKKGNLIGMVG